MKLAWQFTSSTAAAAAAPYLQIMRQLFLCWLSKHESKAAEVPPEQCLVVTGQDGSAFIAVLREVAVAKAGECLSNIKDRLQHTDHAEDSPIALRSALRQALCIHT